MSDGFVIGVALVVLLLAGLVAYFHLERTTR